jgi:hypothetical protein
LPGSFGFVAVGIELEVEHIFGDSLILFLHLFRDLSEGEVGERVIWLDSDGILGSEISTLVVLTVDVEPGDRDVFIDALVVGLNLLYFGEFVAGRNRRHVRVCRGVGIVA